MQSKICRKYGIIGTVHSVVDGNLWQYRWCLKFSKTYTSHVFANDTSNHWIMQILYKWLRCCRRQLQSNFRLLNLLPLLIDFTEFLFIYGLINHKPASVQVMSWCRTGGLPSSEPMMAEFNDAYVCHPASMSWILWDTISIITSESCAKTCSTASSLVKCRINYQWRRRTKFVACKVIIACHKLNGTICLNLVPVVHLYCLVYTNDNDKWSYLWKWWRLICTIGIY